MFYLYLSHCVPWDCPDLRLLLIIFSAEADRCLWGCVCQTKSKCFAWSQSLLTKSLTFSLTQTVFQFAECSNSQSQKPRRRELCCVINAPLSQSLTSTRATMAVWYTPSKLNPLRFFSFLWCNHTWCNHFSQNTFPLFISSNKVLRVSQLQRQQHRMPSAVLRSTRVFISTVPCRGYNDQSLCTTLWAQFTAPPSALAHQSAWQ